MIAPALILVLGGLVLRLIPAVIRPVVILLLPLLTLATIWYVPEDTITSLHLAGFNLIPIYLHPFTRIFATVFAIAAFAGALYGLGNQRLLELSAAFVYAGCAIGCTFSGDFITLFFYWEIMAIASTVIVLCGRTHTARQAALRYAMMHFFGGVMLMLGIILYIQATGTSSLEPLTPFIMAWWHGGSMTPEALAAFVILVGVLVNIGAPPFSSWLPDAYPEASPSGAVFLSAFTTKTAVFVLLTLFAGINFLVAIGLFMVFYGIIYAMLENDARRILSYSVINQVGFMVTGTGIGTELAQFGVATHAFCHIIYKALLFMSAGAVLYRTGKRNCSDLGGLWRPMRLTAICGIIGAMAISAFPWTSGFISKSMITSASAYEHMAWVWFLLVAASAGVFLHAGIKFPWFVFFQKDAGMRPKDAPASMSIAMIFLSALCILPGLLPEPLYALLPKEIDYTAYTPHHVISQLQLLLFAGLSFFVMLPLLKRTETISLDFDWLWRVLLCKFLLYAENLIYCGVNLIKSHGKKVMYQSIAFTRHYHGPNQFFARHQLTSHSVLYALGVLAVMLWVYYIDSL